jgi:hypothetical protein
LQGSSRKFRAFPAVRYRIFAPALRDEAITAERSQSKCWPIFAVALDRLIEKMKRLRDLRAR